MIFCSSFSCKYVLLVVHCYLLEMSVLVLLIAFSEIIAVILNICVHFVLIFLHRNTPRVKYYWRQSLSILTCWRNTSLVCNMSLTLLITWFALLISWSFYKIFQLLIKLAWLCFIKWNKNCQLNLYLICIICCL